MPFFRKLALPLLCAALAAGARRADAAGDEGAKVYQEACTPCHDAKTHPLDKTRLTREKWRDAVERMDGMGAEVPSGKKLSALLDYLEETHGAKGAEPAGEK